MLPGSLLGKAVGYTLRQWEKLIRYLESPYLRPDNNAVEGSIRPFVCGRKNWLFSNTGTGATASAILYSIVETAKANGLLPFDYIMQCLDHVAEHPDELDAILPWNIN